MDFLDGFVEQAFSTVKIDDSKIMQELTQATIRDSAAMKLVSVNVRDQCFMILTGGHQVSYLTMVFLPATFVAVS